MKINLKPYINIRNKGVLLFFFFAWVYLVLLFIYMRYDIEIIDNLLEEYALHIGLFFYILVFIALILSKSSRINHQNEYIENITQKICSKYINNLKIDTGCSFDEDYINELASFEIGDKFETDVVLTGTINNYHILIADLLMQDEIQPNNVTSGKIQFEGFICDVELDIKFPMNLDVHGKYPIDENDILENIRNIRTKENDNSKIKNYRELIINNEIYRNNLRIECDNPIKCNEIIKPELFNLYVELKNQLNGEISTYIRENRIFILVKTKNKLFNENTLKMSEKKAKLLDQNISAITKFIIEFRKNF